MSTAKTEDAIVRFAIYPSIGLARVGNSPAGYYFGPEVPGGPRESQYRDAQGRLKRMAARFRIYGLNRRGKVVKEITASEARITWKVEVANTKAAWYDFLQALDIPASLGTNTAPGVACARRNADVVGAARAGLAITPPAVAISGRNQNPKGAGKYSLTGKFLGTRVYLGEVRTDEGGRLIFLGGRGHSASHTGAPATTFANNLGWYDDTSDGPIEATVEYRGRSHQATGAWVVVGPPDYAPGVLGVVTGYDLVFEVATRLDPSLLPAKPRFSEQIYPLLQRFTRQQWVNAGMARDFGFGTPTDFENPELIKKLNDPSSATQTLRSTIFGWFRNADYQYPVPAAQPPYYGDAVTLNTSTTDPREWMAILGTQYRWLEQWVEGNFVADGVAPAVTWDELSPAEQVRQIDRAVLDEALGGPFHPGAEFTWPMRHESMYRAPFRLKRRTGKVPDWGAQLTSSIALAAKGPLDGCFPGDVTRWMAVPWQADTSSCLSAYLPYVDDYLPTFWPARVPNDVLTEDQYRVLMDSRPSTGDKQTAFAFAQRRKWLRGIRYAELPTYPPKIYPSGPAINKFIGEWDKMGIIEARRGPGGDFPAEVWVETGRRPLTQHPTEVALIKITDES
ncbi:MAG TPA: hypothetical protein DCE44_07780 [Verrucomicrobiales bacterium]|nr:hypothetical protein [Verrucomicrobiales bacterium]